MLVFIYISFKSMTKDDREYLMLNEIMLKKIVRWH